MLEFIPEPMKQLQGRFADALLITYVPAKDMKDRPSEHREHVFDFEDGLRLVVSRDLFAGHIDLVHFSGSVSYWYTGPLDNKLILLFEHRFMQLSQGQAPGRIVFTMLSPKKKIPHWMVIPPHLEHVFLAVDKTAMS